MRLNRFGATLSVVVLAVILVATLTPMSGGVTISFWCLWCGAYPSLDIIANIVMFTPLGFALALATDRRWWSVLACVMTTVVIELLQIRLVAGRDASFSDILANSLGGLVGTELAMRRLLFLRPNARAATRLALGWAAVFASICGLTVLGLRPANVPRSLWVQWTPPRASYEPFSGKLLGFQLDDIVLPLGYPSASLGVDRVLRGSRWRTTTTISTEGLESRRSVIARIAEEFTVLVSVEQLGWDLACIQKTRSSDLRFRSPKVSLRNAFLVANNEAPSVMTLTCGRSDGTLFAGTDGNLEVLRLSPALGWLLLSPFNIGVNSSNAWVSALWLVGLAFPLGYWAAMIGRDRSAGRSRMGLTSVAILFALGFGLAIAPTLAGTSRAAGWEWAAALCGVALGWGTALIVRISAVGPTAGADEVARRR